MLSYFLCPGCLSFIILWHILVLGGDRLSHLILFYLSPPFSEHLNQFFVKFTGLWEDDCQWKHWQWICYGGAMALVPSPGVIPERWHISCPESQYRLICTLPQSQSMQMYWWWRHCILAVLCMALYLLQAPLGTALWARQYYSDCTDDTRPRSPEKLVTGSFPFPLSCPPPSKVYILKG